MVNSHLEKYALFSKGFKGLPDGWHNLRACNFLVGENSTGKSSFLELIQIMDSREHRVFLDILGAVEGIDTAFDVCSRIEGSKETTIGFLIKAKEDDELDFPTGVFGRLATYKKHKEEMLLQRLSIISGKKLLRLKRSQKRISYRIHEFEYDEDISHVSNAEEFENIHLNASNVFREYVNVDWSEISAPVSGWLDAMYKASISLDDLKVTDFISAYSPLHSLHHGPMRTQTRRLHHGSNAVFSPKGEHTPYLLRQTINSAVNLADSINQFGKASGLFDKISVTSIKTKINDKPFALQIEKSGAYFYVDELGVGVGQVLPIISDLLCAPRDSAFLIEQPELHLHPRAQAALGDVFLNFAEGGGTLVVETHSDFIIDRYRLRLKQSEMNTSAQIIYFEKDEFGKNKSYEIPLNPDGTLGTAPDSYRSFFLHESIEKFENL